MKKAPKTKKVRPSTPARRSQPAEPVTPDAEKPSAAPIATAAPASPESPAPSRGRLHRSTLTPAGLRGRDLVRFLRIHTKRPYAKRGEEAIYLLAREVARIGLQELDAAAAGGNR